MDKSAKGRIRQAIEGIQEGDIRPFKGSHVLYRLRVGTRRIVFSYIDTETVLIERIWNRGDVYKGGLL